MIHHLPLPHPHVQRDPISSFREASSLILNRRKTSTWTPQTSVSANRAHNRRDYNGQRRSRDLVTGCNKQCAEAVQSHRCQCVSITLPGRISRLPEKDWEHPRPSQLLSVPYGQQHGKRVDRHQPFRLKFRAASFLQPARLAVHPRPERCPPAGGSRGAPRPVVM